MFSLDMGLFIIRVLMSDSRYNGIKPQPQLVALALHRSFPVPCVSEHCSWQKLLDVYYLYFV